MPKHIAIPQTLPVDPKTFHRGLKNNLGKRFGKLIVLEARRQNHTKKKSIVWLCQCDCGRQVARTAAALNSRTTTSCGCSTYTEEVIRKMSDPHRISEPALHKDFAAYRSGAYARGIEFDLSFEQFKELVTKQCSYCGIENSREVHTKYETVRVNGIDRLDSSKGYVVNNCVSCCHVCNRLKMRHSAYAFVAHIRRIANHLQNTLCLPIQNPKDVYSLPRFTAPSDYTPRIAVC
jgi:hypothetical protein